MELPRAWKVAAADLIKRDEQGRVVAVNLDVRNPTAIEVEAHREPQEILATVVAKERQMLAILDEVGALLAEQVRA